RNSGLPTPTPDTSLDHSCKMNQAGSLVNFPKTTSIEASLVAEQETRDSAAGLPLRECREGLAAEAHNGKSANRNKKNQAMSRPLQGLRLKNTFPRPISLPVTLPTSRQDKK